MNPQLAPALAALRLMLEWGADESLDILPVDRFAEPPAAMASPAASPAVRTMPTPAPAAAGAVSYAVGAPASAGIARAGPASAKTPMHAAEMVAAAAPTIDALQASLASFTGCGLAATASNLVFADGNPHAGLVLIGEAPGAEEDRAGKPFVGPSGRLLDQMLAGIGLDRSHCLITNIIPWRPPGNRNPTDNEVLICLPFLHRHLALLQPQRLMLMGALAARALTGSSAGIRKLRGRWLEVTVPGLESPIPALPTFHPAYLLRQPGAKRDAWSDLITLKCELDRQI